MSATSRLPRVPASPAHRELMRAVALGPAAPLLHAWVKSAVTERPDKPANATFPEEERALLPQGEQLPPPNAKSLESTRVSEVRIDHLYNDAACYCTVGYGHLCYKNHCTGFAPAEYLKGTSRAADMALLPVDMQKAQTAVQAAIPDHRALLNDFQFGTLRDFAFNAGGGNFRSSTFPECVRSGEPNRVPARLRRWIRAGKTTFRDLKIRREREIVLFFEGIAIPGSIPRSDDHVSSLDIFPS